MKKDGFFSAILDLVFPPRCVFCHSLLRRGERGICVSCKGSLPYTEGAGRTQSGEFYDGCWSALYYEGDVRESLLRYKFSGRTEYAGCFAKLLAQLIRENLAGKYDLITWVPLSKERAKDRGFDQSMLLAMAVAVELDDVAVETLNKISNVPAQSGMGDKAKRQANILGAFETPDPELVEGKRLLIIDDIVTTGATLSECARMLKMAGAKSVTAVTIARSRP